MPPRGSSTGSRHAPDQETAASPAATRASRSRWRDPRLVVGVAVVAVCGLLGARFLGGADDTVAVWAAAGPLAEGQQVDGGDLVRREVRFADQADADRYLPAGTPVTGSLTRAVGEGELVPRAALGDGARGGLTEVPLSVGTEAVPSTVDVGSVVDVWVTPDAAPRAAGEAVTAARSTLVLDDVVVVALPRAGSSLGPSATRQVMVGVESDQADALPRSLAALAGGTVLLTARR